MVELDVPSACAGTGCTVFSRISAHLRVIAHPVWSVYMASPCKRPAPFFGL